jgi:hypothetical protein
MLHYIENRIKGISEFEVLTFVNPSRLRSVLLHDKMNAIHADKSLQSYISWLHTGMHTKAHVCVVL